MNISSILGECRSHGVIVFLSNGGMSARGNREALDKFRPVLKKHKAEVVQYLTQHGANDLVREFMEIDGLTLAEAQALAAVSVQPRTPDEWLAMITMLDALIEQYCAATKLADKEKASILASRYSQSAASIPASLEWFQRELSRIEEIKQKQVKAQSIPAPVHERNFEGRAKAARFRMQQPIESRNNHAKN